MQDMISIVVPCFNEQESVNIFYKEVKKHLESLKVKYEILFVDDGSKDNTLNIVKELALKDYLVKYVSFSRNFGKEAAMYAGLKNSKGDYVAIMDVDLQDPPEKLVEMYKILKTEDFDCVATRRSTRKGEPKLRSWFSKMFYKVVNKHSQVKIVDGARDFRLMKRQMVDAILEIKEYNRFSKGIFDFVGFKTKWLEYENIQRVAGKTKWNFRKLFAYAIEGIVSFTLEPLYLILKFAVGLFCLDFVAIIVLLIGKWMTSTAAIILIMILLTSIIIGCLGITSLYIAKSYMEDKNRPIYIEKESNVK